ncbi:MAG: ABC transporter ATP-binding protein [Fusobacterium sp. JB019]|nr:ABC transporter ATP-binding protein [Fusobacterium sp. JB019]
MNLKNNDLIEEIKNIDKNNNIKGAVLVGKNNSGKTYKLNNLFLELYKNQEETYLPFDLKKNLEQEFKIDSVIYFSKAIITGGISSNSGKSILENLDGDLEINLKNDTLINTSISQILFSTLKYDSEYYYSNLIKKYLNLNLKYSSEQNELLITTDAEESNLKTDENYFLKSSGYLSLIRIIVLIDFFMKKNCETLKWILIDEPDAFLDSENRTIFLNILQEILSNYSCRAKIIISSHNSETLFSLPNNYYIYQLINKNYYKKYYSQDFFNKPKLEEILFSQNNNLLKLSSNMNTLINCYKNSLIGTKYRRLTDEKELIFLLNIEKNTKETIKKPLTIKEQIILNSILGGNYD